MPHKGFVHVGSNVIVKFFANHTNNGASSILTGYVPDPNADPPPSPQFDTVAPGGSATHSLNPVVRAFQIRITVDVPDDNGSGLLEVSENNTVLDRSPISSDTIWAYTVL
jgi:hypothetical protein